MSQQPYTLRSLAETCGVSVQAIHKHVRQNTLRLAAAKTKVPGLGVFFSAAQAEKFVSAMQAKRKEVV